MRQIAFILVGLFPLVAYGQGEIPTESDLRAKVADVAALAVRNTDDLASLRDRVAGLEGKLPSLESRIEQLENRVFEVVTPSIPPVIREVVTGPVFQTVVPQVISQRTVTRPVRQVAPVQSRLVFRTPLRSLLFGRRNVKSNSVGYVYPPAGVSVWDHLAGPPHYISDPWKLSYNQAMELHTSLH